MIVFDTETYRFGPGEMAPRIVCVSWCKSLDPLHCGLLTRNGGYTWYGSLSDKNRIYSSDCKLEKAIVDILFEDCIVGQNVAYDMACVMANFPALQPLVWKAYEEDRVRDTMLRQKLEALKDGELHTRGFSLAKLARGMLGVELDKETHRMSYGELDGVSLVEWEPGSIQYSVDDAIVTYAIWERSNYVSSDEWLRVRGDLALRLDTCWGAETNQKSVEALKQDLEVRLRALDLALMPSGLIRENGTKNMVAIRARVEETYLDHERTKKTKLVKADSLALLQSGDPWLKMLEERNRVRKVFNDFVPKLLPLIHPSFDSLKLTGRISCYEPNLQQIPGDEGVRECFIPRPGYLYVGLDVSRAELCGIAEVCTGSFGFSILGDTLRAGIDPHSLVGAHLEGVTYEEFEHIRKNKTHLISKQYNKTRALAKIANFGLWGGMGFKAFTRHALKAGFIVTLAESKVLKQLLKQIFPEMGLFFNEVGARGRNHIRRQLYSGRLRGDLGYTDGCNTQFQGLIADAMLEVTYELQFACRANTSSPLFGCYPNFPVHDEWITEVPIDRAQECAIAKEKLVIHTFERWITTVPIQCEWKIMEVWAK